MPESWLESNLEVLAQRGINLRAISAPHANRAQAPAPAAISSGGAPLYLLGFPSATFLRELFDLNPPHADGYVPPIHLIEPDLEHLARALCGADLSAVLADERLRLFVGETALDQFAQWLASRHPYEIKGPLISAEPTSTDARALERILSDAAASQAQTLERLNSKNTAAYAGRGTQTWAERFEAFSSSAGADPLRVLIPTTLYSTYVGSASADLARAFEQLGCSVRLLTEPDHSTRLTSLAYAQAVDELRPDLVLLVNYTRQHLHPAFPEGLPFVCWIQDALQHLFDPAVGRAQGPLDFLVGHPHPALFREFGYSRQRAMFSPVLASEAKFAAPSTPANDHLDCEIACATNHAQTPAQLREQLLASAGNNRLFQTVLDELTDAITAIVSQVSLISFPEAARQAVLDALARHGLAQDEAQVTALMNQVCAPLGDRLIRHQTLEWAAQIVQQRNWRLRIHGIGWEHHPTLAPWAQGPLAHGDALRTSYRTSGVHLHASINWNLHQRVMECALSGGLPLSRFKFSDIELLAVYTRARLAQIAHQTGRSAAAAPGKPIALSIFEHPDALQLYAQLQRLGPHYLVRLARAGATDGAIELTSEFLADPWAYFGGLHVDREVPWLLGDLSETTFDSPARLETLVECAIDRPAWRSNISRGIAGRTRRHLTYERAAERIIEFVGTSCAAAQSPTLCATA